MFNHSLRLYGEIQHLDGVATMKLLLDRRMQATYILNTVFPFAGLLRPLLMEMRRSSGLNNPSLLVEEHGSVRRNQISLQIWLFA